jgi:hypothetical protein
MPTLMRINAGRPECAMISSFAGKPDAGNVVVRQTAAARRKTGGGLNMYYDDPGTERRVR